jgi:hypothetical protein
LTSRVDQGRAFCLALYSFKGNDMPAKYRLSSKQKKELAEIAKLRGEKLGRSICGGRAKHGDICESPSGTGTDHLGQGRCYLHGGRNQSPQSKVYKTGEAAKIKYASILEKVEQLKIDRDIYDLRDHIFLIEATAQTLLEKAETEQDLLAVVKVIETATKAIQRLHDIEVGRKYVISVENLGGIIARIVGVIERHVPDPYLRSLIAEDIVKVHSQPLLPILSQTIDARNIN